MDDYRETVLTLGWERHVIRTERGKRSVSAMEIAHTKAVKAALIAHRAGMAEAQYADTAASAERVRKAAEQRHVKMGFEYSTPEIAGDNAVTRLMTTAELQRDKALKTAKRFPSHTRGLEYVDCRKGDGPVRYTSIDPDVLVSEWSDVSHEYI